MLTREQGTLNADACSAYGAPTTLVGTPAQSGLATGCYRYTLTGTDNVGNTSTVTTVVKVDTSAPAAPGLVLSDSSADVHTTGTTAFYRPAGTGSFDVTASSTDGQSGILDYGFPVLAGFTGSGAGATRTYTLATPTEPNGAKPVTARNQALLSSTATNFTLTSDSTGPTGGALTVNGTVATGGGSGSYDNDGNVTIGLRTDYNADGGSGVNTSTLTREDGTLNADVCSAYGAPTTLVGTPAQSGLATGCYRYTLTGTDNVGNATAITTVVKVDLTDPTAPSLSLADTSADVHTTGTTAFYRPAGSGSFDVTASSTDGQSGIASYSFPALAGFTLSGSGGARTYTLATPTEPDGAKTVTANNNAGRTNSSTFTLTADSAAPVGGALTVNGGIASGGGSQSYDNDGTFTIGLRTDYTDAISGLATSTLTREDGTLSADACSAYGAPSTLVGTPAQSGLATGCYRYTLTGTDRVGNAVSITTVVKVDTSAPAAPGLALSDSSADVHTTGTTAFYRPAGSGSFDVTASSTDAQSGILDYSFPALAGFTGSGTGATRTYTLATPTEPNGAKTVNARNNALLTAGSTFTLTSDSVGPTGGALTVNGAAASGGGTQSYDGDGSFPIDARTNYNADALSGFATSVLTREDGTLAGDACSSYGAPATIVGTPAQSGLATGCYRYVLTGTDNVGNTTTITTVVKVDASDPTAPSLSLSDSSAAVHTTGTTAFYRPTGSGSFDVTASSTDGQSGIASYSFPALAGFTTSGAGASRTYTLATPTEPDGAKTVSVQNNAGRSNSSNFTLTSDAIDPTGGALVVNGVASSLVGTQSYDDDGSFTIGTRTDYADTLSGLASSTLTREDGSLAGDACSSYGAPATIVGAPAQNGLATGCYRYTLTGVDNVGNSVSRSTVVKVDLTDPTAPSLSLSDSSADVHTVGTTAFYRPAGTGSFDVTASSTDGQSGIASYSFPTLAGFVASGSGATKTYTLNTPTEADGGKTVTAQNNAGRTNGSTFTLTADSTAPSGGSITVNGGGSYDTDGTVALAKTNHTDGGSGIASQTFTRATATLVNDVCGSFAGTDPVTILAGNDADTLSSGCYRYTLTATDNVGNQVVTQSAIVKVDVTAPTAPTLTLSNATGSAHYPGSGSTIWFRSAAGAGGSFDVTASSTDAQTGVASYSFPTLGAGWSQTGSGATRTYTYVDAAATPGAKNVTATNGAGNGSANGTFTVSNDTTTPTGGSITANGGGAYDGDGTVALAQTNFTDAGAGIAGHTLTRAERNARRRRVRLVHRQRPGHDHGRQRRRHAHHRLLPLHAHRHRQRRQPVERSEHDRQGRHLRAECPEPRPLQSLCERALRSRHALHPPVGGWNVPRHRDVDRPAHGRRVVCVRPAEHERRHELQRLADRRSLRLHVQRHDDRAEHRTDRHRFQPRRRRLEHRHVHDRRGHERPDDDPQRSRREPPRHDRSHRDGDRSGCGRRQRRVPALPRRRRHLGDDLRRLHAGRRLLLELRHDARNRGPLRPARTRDRCDRQHQHGRGRKPPDRQHQPDRLGHLARRRLERQRLDRARKQLRGRGLGCRHDRVPALACRRGYLDEPVFAVGNLGRHRWSLRPPRRDDGQRR